MLAVLDRILDKRSNGCNVVWHKYQTKGTREKSTPVVSAGL